MDGSIHVSIEERKALLQVYRFGTDARAARRAHIVLLIADGWSQRDVRSTVFASFKLIGECVRSWHHGGLAALLAPSAPARWPRWWAKLSNWLERKTPQDFGYFRTRWSCEILAEVLAWETGVRRSAETIRRAMRAMNWVWRRPRPVVGPVDAEYDHKVQQIHQLLARLPADETALFQDEVDVHLNPKIGSCWMPRGKQAEIVTPGNNDKQHIAGSLHWRTGTLLVSPPARQRNSRLFVQHLDYLRRNLRSYRLLHIICDNAAFHRSREVQRYLARWGHRVKLHFLPKYAPETNPIERVWWHFHETVTRNHRCHNLPQLLKHAYEWFGQHHGFYKEMSQIVGLAA